MGGKSINRLTCLTYLHHLLLVVFIAAAFAETPPAVVDDGFGLSHVVKLHEMDVDDASLITAIRGAEKVSFDTSVDGLITMKQAGLSDAVIAAVIERSAKSEKISTRDLLPVENQSGFSTANGATVCQNGTTLNLAITTGYNQFLPGKNSPMKVLSETAGPGIAFGAASMLGAGALGAAGGAAIMAGPVIGLVNLHRAKTIKGYEYELLQGTSSTTPLASAPAEFTIPYSAYSDNRYRVAEPHLFRLTVNTESQTRVLGTAKGSVKYKQITNETSNKKLEPFEREEVPAEFGKTPSGITAQIDALAPGEYAIVFLYDGETLDNSIDFSVR